MCDLLNIAIIDILEWYSKVDNLASNKLYEILENIADIT